MKLAYLDCFSGISGDMLLAALIACGAAPAAIEESLRRLGAGDLRLRTESVRRGALVGTQVFIEAPAEKMHRNLAAIEKMIGEAALAAAVKEKSIRIFRRLGAVEAALHGTTLEKIHFHEVGALDSIADIVGCCCALEMLGIEKMQCSPLNVGGGTAECEHGRLPVPAPATVELLKGIPVYSSGIETELVTPTGAAIVATLAARFGPLPALRLEAVGYGAGARNLEEQPNLLRVMIGESAEQEAGIPPEALAPAGRERLVLLEANVDDMNPQVCGFFFERAFATGALDVFFAPVQMKKNRPGVLLSVLCRPAQSEALMDLFFQETTTLGVRSSEVLRRALERESVEVATKYGTVRMKVARQRGRVMHCSPEFEDCRRAALERHVPLKQVLAEAVSEFEKRNGEKS